MISELAESDGRRRTFVIQPNPPIAWRTLLCVFVAMAVFILSIGLAAALAGLPLVLPFSGLEVLVLGTALYLSAAHGSVREVVRIGDVDVVYEAGRKVPVVSVSFQRHWARVVLERVHDGWYPSRLLIRSHGRQVEVGRFLDEQERLRLAKQLQCELRRNSVEKQSISVSADRCRGLEP